MSLDFSLTVKKYLEGDYQGREFKGSKNWKTFFLKLSKEWQTDEFIEIVENAREKVLKKNESLWVSIVKIFVWNPMQGEEYKGDEAALEKDFKIFKRKAEIFIMELLSSMSSDLDVTSSEGTPIWPEEEDALWRKIDEYSEKYELYEKKGVTDSLDVSRLLKKAIANEAVRVAYDQQVANW